MRRSTDFPLPSCAAPALAVRVRLPRSGKSSRLVRSLRSKPRRVRMRLGDRCQAELLPAVIRDLRGSHRPDSPRGIAAPIFQLRRAWPAPDGRRRPAPARRGTAAMSEIDHREVSITSRIHRRFRPGESVLQAVADFKEMLTVARRNTSALRWSGMLVAGRCACGALDKRVRYEHLFSGISGAAVVCARNGWPHAGVCAR